MRHIKLFAMVLAIAGAASIASAQIVNENFDSLNVGANPHSLAGWEGWYGDAGVGGSVTDEQAYSGNHSLRFTRPVDLVPYWESPTSGKWILVTMQYVPSAATSGDAYYGVLSSYEESTAGTAGWITEVISDFASGDVRISGGDTARVPLVRDAWAEIKVELDFDAQLGTFYYNNELLGTREATSLSGLDLWANSDAVMYFDDFWLGSMAMYKVQASKLFPEDGVSDVARDVTLGWKSGFFADKHDVYFGTVLSDVIDATREKTLGVLVSQGQSPTTYEPDGLLEFGQTYYWRVDEVNGAPDFTVFPGEVQSFTAEPYSIQIAADAMTVTASSTFANSDVNKIIDGSGLDEDGLHSNSPAHMWMSGSPDPSPSLTFELDQMQKLDKMLIWNSNNSAEPAVGWGIKDVDIQISLDGVDWTSIPDVSPLTQGPGNVPSEAQVIDMQLVQAKYVRFDILNNWGGLLPQYSVSEVQIYSLPTQARMPSPASGAVDILPDAVVTWRAGREAERHIIYVGANAEAVADGSALSVSSNTNSLALAALDLQLGETYYWRVDEVNEAETPAITTGVVWSLNTATRLTVDDFEGYNNLSPDRPFQTWLDGFGYSSDEFFPVAYQGNGTGAGIGHDIWSLTSPHFGGAIMETATTINGSRQALPFYFSGDSQTDRTFASPQDWTLGGVTTLSISVHGNTNLGAADQLYLMINNTQVMYDGDLSDPTYTPWHVDLTALGIDLTSVTSLSFGVESTGSGMILLDDIVLE